MSANTNGAERAVSYTGTLQGRLRHLQRHGFRLISRESKPFFGASAIRMAFCGGNVFAAIVCFWLQLIIDPSKENILCALFSVIAVVITAAYCFRRIPIQRHLWSTLSVYGGSLVAIGTALFGMTLEWRPLTFNLGFPLLTFGSSLALVIVMIAAHALFTHLPVLSSVSGRIQQYIYRPLGLLRVPNDAELWILGAIGVFSLLKSGVGDALYGANAIETGNVGGKFLQSLIVFVIAPYISMFKNGLVANNAKRSSMSWWLLGAYSVVVIGLAMARNSRGTFAEVGLIIGVCVLAMLLKGSIRITSRTLVIAAAVAVIGIPCLSVVGNLAEAMRLVRGDRYSLSTEALVAKTIDVMMQPELIHYMKDRDNVITNGYNEIYFKSEFLTRFSITKFTDLNWRGVGGFPEVNPALHDRAVGDLEMRLIAFLPAPLIDAFHINIDKNSAEFNSSSGDMYAEYSSISHRGSFLTGSVICDAYVLFGALAPFCLFAMFVVYFVLLDSFLTFNTKGTVFVLAVSALLAAKIFQSALVPEGFYVYFGFWIRQVAQLVLFYAAITSATNMTLNWIGSPGGIAARNITRQHVRQMKR